MGHLESEKVPDPTIGMELNLLCIFFRINDGTQN